MGLFFPLQGEQLSCTSSNGGSRTGQTWKKDFMDVVHSVTSTK